MNRREDPREPQPRRATPISRPPQQPRGGPRGPHSAPPQRPAGPEGRPEEPWYLEFRRPPAPPPSRAPLPPPVRRGPPADARPPARDTGPTPPASKRPSNRALLIAAGISVLLAVAVCSALLLRGGFVLDGPVQLDVLAAQDGVARVLADPVNGYGRDDITAVRCNNGVNPTVRRGATFTCAVTVDRAQQRQVLVEFVDDAGTYQVDRPR